MNERYDGDDRESRTAFRAYDTLSEPVSGRTPWQIWRDACAWQAARATPADHSKLQVWSGSMPESNGKTNFTAILHRGDIIEGFTIDRSEYPDRVRYEADRVRWLIGEIDKEPWILDYDADKHSGYATPADQEPIGWEYYEEGKLFKTYDSADKADHAKKMFGGVVRPIFAPADHIVDANKKVDAGSVPVAEMPLTSGAGPQKLAWFKHPDSFAPGTKLYAQPPQPEAQSVRDVVTNAAINYVDTFEKAGKYPNPDLMLNAWAQLSVAVRALKSAPPQKPSTSKESF